VVLLERQIEAFDPEVVAVGKESDARELRRKFPTLTVLSGKEGLTALADGFDYDVMLNALVGIAGLEPTLAAIENGRRRNVASGRTQCTRFEIALANKESLVTGGRFVMDAAACAGVPIIPVDSEHSAIFQCMAGNSAKQVERIWLTASGGPFKGWSREQIDGVSIGQALAHPSWSMGPKITIDSATMMNKGFEVIEAGWLFGLGPEQIEVLIQPGSIIHSMVGFADGAVMAQLGAPSMKVPIAYALSYPERWELDVPRLAFSEMDGIGLSRPSGVVAQSLALAYDALREAVAGRDSAAICLNGANEALVENFLGGRIGFGDIIDTLKRIMARHVSRSVKDVEDILAIDSDARREVQTS
jgi:1-deoxy-D-xylulose-5-phosphate reductoisomerase